MKNIVVLVISSFLYLTSFTQGTLIEVYPIDSVGCVKQIQFVISNSSTSSDQGSFTINWGDGGTDQQNYSIQAGGNSFYILSHSYLNGGNYTIDVTAESDFSVVSVIFPQSSQTISAVGSSNCGYAYFYSTFGNQNCSSSILTDVLLDFTDAQGNTSSISSMYPNWYTVYNGLNPAAAPYTVTINDAWLLANNLVQVSNDITITDFHPNGEAISNIYNFTVDWTATPPVADPEFNFGSAWNFVAPLQTGSLVLYYSNFTCAPMSSSMTVTVDMPPLFVPNTANLLNPSVVGNTLTFDVNGFSGSENSLIQFTFPGTTPAGTSFCFDVSLSYATDANPSNNVGQVCGVVLNSYDPNDKQVNFYERLNPDVKEKLIYRIQFQNDGNYNAVNVKISDTIAQNLDLSTFRVLESSHGLETSINSTSRKIDFKFNNIFLGISSENLAASQGYVVYEIYENDNLGEGTEIENTAYIYFDFNPAIITNTTYNINEYPLGISLLEKENVVIYPNPANDRIFIQSDEMIELNIVDLSGKRVLSQAANALNSYSIQTLSEGLYTVIIKTNKGISISKLNIVR
jgi:uncharacterized repeat protein (TIGR01451 family)